MGRRWICKQGMAVIVALAVFSPTAWAGPATDQLKATLTQMVEILKDPKLKAPDKGEERRAALHNVLKVRFDEEALAKRALGKKHWTSLSRQEQEAFVTVFTAVLEQTYFKMIDEELEGAGPISADNIHYLGETVKGSYAQIPTRIVADQDNETPVLFRLKNNAGVWLVVDMAIEGVIVTKNYRAQFNEILAKHPFSELIEKLKAKQPTK